ncbi:hypothetical protein [Amycolatopsis saalfeldensis]|uniref:4-hydroxy-tetrahydrodipicolinate reductase n=1 Tax=Amycolatopsis saalfeldensis TaxID=394193 RepID=A0A1H8U067_9PSEU|nr:hypothetical protein [Amycolatopsis saalfeldensis]SEO96571.1 4-hydroxy-tetrahydrodipicolinate reductase [Amycolatopsis saalfeldensis]
MRFRFVGLGATGAAIASIIVGDPGCEIVDAVDRSERLHGRPLREVVAGYAGDLAVGEDVAVEVTADVAVVCTSSRLEEIAPTIEFLIEQGCHVLTIAEEMGFPRWSDGELARHLDSLAVGRGVSVLGTGCNPGMIMDTLPAVLSGLVSQVRGVEITRSADMSRYGGILAKFGLALTPAEFDEQVAQGRVIGHIGFAQSISALADVFGWRLDRIELDPVTRVGVAASDLAGTHLRLRRGSVNVVRHCARGVVDGSVRVDIRTYFGVFGPEDDVPRGDTLTLTGTDQTVRLEVPRGYESFLSTVAMAANSARALPSLAPGLRTMADLTVRQIACKPAAPGMTGSS